MNVIKDNKKKKNYLVQNLIIFSKVFEWTIRAFFLKEPFLHRSNKKRKITICLYILEENMHQYRT